MSQVARRLGAVTLPAVALLALVACAPTSGGTSASSGSSVSPSPDTCAESSLPLKSPGKLTIATDNPAYEPWFVDNKPSNGKGFESAIAYAVAAKMGFLTTQVTWTTASFNAVIAPGPKNFDFDINEVSITAARRKAVDFSSGYYDVTQAVVTIKGSRIADAKGIADLKNAKLGAQVGTTSYQTIKNVIKPDKQAAVFNTNDDAKLALTNGQVDGLVLDLPTALYEANADLKNGVLVGQFANTGGTPEQFGLVLDLGSKLTPCVSKAVDALRQDGSLKQIEQQWLTDSAGAPVLS